MERCIELKVGSWRLKAGCGAASLDWRLTSPISKLAQFGYVGLQVSLLNLGELVSNDDSHLFFGEAQSQNRQRVFGRLPVSEFLFAVRHLEQVHVMGIAEAAHWVL